MPASKASIQSFGRTRGGHFWVEANRKQQWSAGFAISIRDGDENPWFIVHSSSPKLELASSPISNRTLAHRSPHGNPGWNTHRSTSVKTQDDTSVRQSSMASSHNHRAARANAWGGDQHSLYPIALSLTSGEGPLMLGASEASGWLSHFLCPARVAEVP